MFSCSACGTNFSYIYLYLSHVRNFHRYNPSYNFVCGLNNCPKTLTTFFSFNKHLRQHQEFQDKSSDVKLMCKVCGYNTYLKSKYISHFKQHSDISCPIKNCKQTYVNFLSFKSHLRRHHPCFSHNDFKHDCLSEINLINTLQGPFNEIPHDNCSNQNFVGSKEFSENSLQISKYNRNVLLFILKMQEKFLLSHSTICEIINGMNEFQSDTISLTKQAIIQNLRENNADDNTLNLVLNTNTLCNLNSTLNIMKSEHLLKKYLRDNMNLVEPVEYTLRSGTKTSSYQYIPILKNIQVLCQNDEILDFIASKQINKDETVLSDIYDGTTFKNNPLFQSFPNIQILLYFDEFMAFNPLRGNQGKHKLGAFYFTLGNLPLKYRSNVKDMQLVLMCKSSDLKHFGFKTVLDPFIKDLKLLESDGISISGIPCKVKGGLACIIGDNLGAHQIGGYITSFSGNTPCCRFCLASKNDMQTQFTASKFVRRTKDLYNQHLSLAEIDDKYISVYGVRSNSPFNSLKYFHTSTMLPPDAMHDLLEGIVPFELGKIINYLILKKYITLDYLNSKIRYTKYGFHDAANKPSELSNFNSGIKMTASRMWCFLRFLPIFVGQSVPQSEPIWHLLLLLKEIVDIVLSPRINLLHVSYLSDIIQDHHNLFKTLFPNVKLIPKFHFLVHYPQLILEFGPLTSVWSMRFEAKHLYFKRVAQSTKNNINLPYSLAKRHLQLQCYYNFESLRSVGKFDGVTSMKTIDMSRYSTEVTQKLIGYEDFYSLSKLDLNGITYKTGMCLVSGFKNDEPVFEKIIAILRKGTVTKFLCQTYVSNTFFHIGGFKLESSKNYKILHLENFVDMYPLSLYRYNGILVIIPKYLILNSEE